MPSSKLKDVLRSGALTVLVTVALAASALAAEHEKLRIPVGRAEVVQSNDDVRTVAIAEPKIADAAVGSARTVVVNAKATGYTSLVVYSEGGKFKVYDIEVYTPNGEKQVLLHVNVAELTNNAKKELGLDLLGHVVNNVPWLDGSLAGGLYTTKVETPSDPLLIGPSTDGFLGYSRNDGKFDMEATWRALEEKGDIRTLANPSLISRSGEKATFLAGGEFPVPVASGGGGIAGTGTGVTVSTISATIEWKEFGVKVAFTPTILENGMISLEVAPEVSSLDFSNPLILSGFRYPILLTRKASTVVSLGTNEHLVIGGLKQTEKSKSTKRIPVLGQIPILNWLFSTTRTESTEKELLIVVSPEIVDAASTTLPALPTDRPERK